MGGKLRRIKSLFNSSKPYISSLLLLACLLFPAAAPAAGKIESIRFRSEGDACFVLVQAKGMTKFSYSFLEDPPRLLLDLFEVQKVASDRTIETPENPYFYRIRTGDQLDKGGKYIRVVIDLKKKADYQVSRDPQGLLIRLSEKVGTSNASQPSVASQQKSLPVIEQVENPGVRSHLDVDIGPEDLLEVNVFEMPQFNVTGRVSGDGTFTMPLIGSVEVAGLSKPLAEKKIEAALEAKYVNNANVSIHIKEYKSKQIAVLGSVHNPGPYYILSHRTLLQVISDAGGLTPDAGRKCFIFRSDSSKVEIDLSDLMKSGNPNLNVRIYPGDVVNIPALEKMIVYVLGEVRSPGAIEMPSSMPMTLLAAIARAGGLTDRAGKSKIQIRRRNQSGEETVLKANVEDILKGKAADIELYPADVVNVPESFF